MFLWIFSNNIYNPKNGYRDLLGEITKIELKNNATIIHFNKKNKNEKWFVIPRKLFLDTEINNTRFFVLKTENIELGEKILLKDNEEINYVIYFQPIDELTKIIRIWYEDDFQETYKEPAETGGALTLEIEIQTNKTLKKSEKAFSKNSFEDALVKSEKENKNMIVYFTAGWCGPCRWMDKNIFSDEEVNTFIKSNYIALKIDVDSYQGEKLRKIYTGDGIPHFFIINSKGDILKEKVGSMKKTEFLDFIMINSTPTKEIFGSKNKTEFTSSVITDSITNKGIVSTNIKSEFSGDIIIDYTTPMESTIESNKSEDIKEKGIGLRLGLVNNNISNYFNSESRTGMTVDLFYSIEYNRRYLIRSGIGFASKGIDGLTINYLKFQLNLVIQFIKVLFYSSLVL